MTYLHIAQRVKADHGIPNGYSPFVEKIQTGSLLYKGEIVCIKKKVRSQSHLHKFLKREGAVVRRSDDLRSDLPRLEIIGF